MEPGARGKRRVAAFAGAPTLAAFMPESPASPSLPYALRAIAYWTPFTFRTAYLGIASCIGGPLTGGEFSRACMKRWCTATLEQLRIDVETDGLGNIPRDEAAVLVSNHVSSLDILVLGAVLDVDYKWAAKRILFNVPFLGWHLRIAGHIPVDRSSGNAMRVLDRAFGKALGQGKYLLLFPEGTRSDTGELKPFRSGAFVTAIKYQAPVVPVVIEGTEALLPKNEWCLDESARKTVRVRVLDAVVPPKAPLELAGANADAPARGAGDAQDSMRALSAALGNRVRSAMADALDDLKGIRRTKAARAPREQQVAAPN